MNHNQDEQGNEIDETIDETLELEADHDALKVLPKVYAYGHDFGNSELGGVLIKGTKILSRSVPTAFAKVNVNVMRNMGVDTTEALTVQLDGEQTTFGIGTVALSQSTDPWSGRGDIQRYASQHSLRGLLAMSASFIPDRGPYIFTPRFPR